MPIALISTNPLAILETWPDGLVNVNVPGNIQAYGVDAGWTSPDGAYKLVPVAEFSPPTGDVISGAPTFSFDANGNVIVTYQVQPAPAPTVTALAFRQLFTSAERLAITTAGESNAAIREFMDDESASGEVTLTDPEVTTGVAALVTAGLLTQTRADQVMAGTAAP